MKFNDIETLKAYIEGVVEGLRDQIEIIERERVSSYGAGKIEGLEIAERVLADITKDEVPDDNI